MSKRSIDRRRHIPPRKCLGCGEEEIKGESNLIGGGTDCITYSAAHCWDCFKINRISDVLANFISFGNAEREAQRDVVRRIIIERICKSKELREYMGIDLDREISVDSLMNGEEDLAERLRHTEKWEKENYPEGEIAKWFDGLSKEFREKNMK